MAGIQLDSQIVDAFYSYDGRASRGFNIIWHFNSTKNISFNELLTCCECRSVFWLKYCWWQTVRGRCFWTNLGSKWINFLRGMKLVKPVGNRLGGGGESLIDIPFAGKPELRNISILRRNLIDLLQQSTLLRINFLCQFCFNQNLHLYCSADKVVITKWLFCREHFRSNQILDDSYSTIRETIPMRLYEHDVMAFYQRRVCSDLWRCHSEQFASKEFANQLRVLITADKRFWR